jgi:hypothetical protein
VPISKKRGVLLVVRVHPPLWPLFTDWKTPVMSVERLARRAVRRHRHEQGIVISFAGQRDAVLDVKVNGLSVVSLVGHRERPWFVSLDSAERWAIRASLAESAERCEVLVECPGNQRIEWLHFSSVDSRLRCDATTVRPAVPSVGADTKSGAR